PPTSPLFPYTTLFRSLFTDIVQWHPRRQEPARHDDATERRRQLGDAERHQQFERSVHSRIRATRAVRPVRSSYAAVKYGSDSGRDRKSTRLNSSHDQI